MDHRSSQRVSLACLACRKQHMRCDAVRPTCGRCQALSKHCSYAESRRTGKKNHARTKDQVLQPQISHVNDLCEVQDVTLNVELDLSPLGMPENQADHLLNVYYERFHPSHPFALPRRSIQSYSTGTWPNLIPLINIMKYIGSFYLPNLTSDIDIDRSLPPTTADGFSVQSLLLMAFVKSMCNEHNASEQLLTQAIDTARLIGMYEKDFATTHPSGDQVLAESWRRTWWMLYITQSYFSVNRRGFNPTLLHIDHEVDLPCEDVEYEALNVPASAKTSKQYRNAEFALEEMSFSSFSYLIDASRIFSKSIRAAFLYTSVGQAKAICGDLEASIRSWFLALPPSKRHPGDKPDHIDQLMVQAQIMMHTALAFIHRPLSTLPLDMAECLSTCPPPPPPLIADSPHQQNHHSRLHTEKLFKALREQNECLLSLPFRAAQLSPSVICMIACGTIAYLVACKTAFDPEMAESGRARIRICLGTLREYEDTWPRAKAILLELKHIAHIILEIDGGRQNSISMHTRVTEQFAFSPGLLSGDWLSDLHTDIS